MRLHRFFAIAVATLVFFSLRATGQAHVVKPDSPPSPDDRTDALQRELEVRTGALERRVDAAIDMMNKRFDDASRTADHILLLMGAFGALSAGFAFTSWHYGRQDYKDERRIFEAHEASMFSNGPDSMLTRQLESVTKLKDVIELVRQSFTLQINREADLQSVSRILQDLNRHFKEAYANVHDHMISLSGISRMGWVNLTLAQAELAATARADFRSIPESVLQEQQTSDPYEFAKVCQLLGVSAFYANDISLAQRLLERARNTYRTLSIREDHLDPRAAGSFFLGLIAKSWLPEHARLEDGLAQAEQCLEEARDLLKGKSGEYLVPVTLAETRSYIEADRNRALRELKVTIGQLEESASLNDNQKKLLVRALVMRGNLEPDNDAGLVAYKKALDRDPENPYATLSLALASTDMTARATLFRDGLQSLRKAKSLEKPEITTRATALVWAIVASHEISDSEGRDAYLKNLAALRDGAVSTAGRIPLFFCPITKRLCLFDDLQKNVKVFIGKRQET